MVFSAYLPRNEFAHHFNYKQKHLSLPNKIAAVSHISLLFLNLKAHVCVLVCVLLGLFLWGVIENIREKRLAISIS